MATFVSDLKAKLRVRNNKSVTSLCLELEEEEDAQGQQHLGLEQEEQGRSSSKNTLEQETLGEDTRGTRARAKFF